MDLLTAAISKYGTKHIGGITVGNERILLAYGDSGSATDANGVAARTIVLDYVQRANATLTGLGLDKTIPVGTSDAGAAATVELCAGVDYYMGELNAFWNFPLPLPPH
jgi:glucan 1,3-beta-glucosidase